MLGAWASGELACSRSSAGGTLRVAARAARWPVAVEDGPAALNSSSGGSGIGLDRSLNYWRRLVKRTRPGLRHHHAPGRQCGGRRRSVRMPLPTMSGSWRGSRCLLGNLCRRFLLGRNGDRLGSRWDRNHFRLNWLGNRSSHNRRCLNFNLGRGCWGFDSCSRWWSGRYRVLYDHSHRGRRLGNGRTLCEYGACRGLGDYRLGRRSRGNGWRNRRTNDNGRRGTRLGNNLARLRLGWSCGRRRDGDNRRSWTRRSLDRLRCRTPRHTALPSLFFLFLFLGQDGLQHVAGLGDMR